jgi:thiol:disulfide interchange protein DsbD
MCTPPASETVEASLKITGASGGSQAAAAQVKALEKDPAADKNAGSKPESSSSFAKFYERSVFLAVAMAFLWGIISSLTPCVYPMIPITVAFFGSQTRERSKKKTFALALVFTVGMALSFAALGVIVTLIGVDMGSVMSNAWIVAFVTLLLLFFAGAMFELYEIRMPDSVMSKVGQSEQGYFGAFTMGLTMGLVAAPCVGPFAGSLLIFVSTINAPATGFLMLFSYGMGLGMLFLAVAMGANFLPRSGMWMVRLKNFFGLVILWLTLYFMQFVTPAYLMLAAASFYAVVTASILGVFSAVDENTPLANHFAKGAGAVCLALATLFAVMAVLVSGAAGTAGLRSFAPARTETVNADSKDSWIKDYNEGMKLARSEKKPVIIDFYADWCLPCKQIESEIFKNPDFLKAAERFIKIKLDCTDSSGEGALIKNQKYKSPYMPYIIFYDGTGNKTEFEIRGYTSLKEILDILEKVR